MRLDTLTRSQTTSKPVSALDIIVTAISILASNKVVCDTLTIRLAHSLSAAEAAETVRADSAASIDFLRTVYVALEVAAALGIVRLDTAFNELPIKEAEARYAV